LEVEKGLKIQV
jgi:chromosome segregation ATPase